MKAVVYRGIGDIRLEDVPKPHIKGPEKLDVTPMITHSLPLAEAQRGYEIFDKKLDGAIKVILKT